jgi:hypothetical protein
VEWRSKKKNFERLEERINEDKSLLVDASSALLSIPAAAMRTAIW